MRSRNRCQTLWMPLALLCCGACVSSSPGGEVERSWPLEAPRVRLERVIRTSRDLGRAELFRRLAGAGSSALFERPFDVAWDGEALLVADPGAGRVVRIDGSRKVARTAPGLLASPVAIATCRAGIVVVDSLQERVVILDRSLEIRRTLAHDLRRPSGVACSRGRIWVSETGAHRILALTDEEGVADPVLARFGERGADSGQLNYPVGLVSDADTLWVVDTLNFRLVRVDAGTGEVRASFGRLGDAPGEMPRTKGVTIDAAGRLWVSDSYLDQVALHTREGQFLMSLGGLGEEPGRFSFPAGLAAHPDGRVAIADSLNRRVQIFRVTADGSSEPGGR